MELVQPWPLKKYVSKHFINCSVRLGSRDLWPKRCTSRKIKFWLQSTTEKLYLGIVLLFTTVQSITKQQIKMMGRYMGDNRHKWLGKLQDSKTSWTFNYSNFTKFPKKTLVYCSSILTPVLCSADIQSGTWFDAILSCPSDPCIPRVSIFQDKVPLDFTKPESLS